MAIVRATYGAENITCWSGVKSLRKILRSKLSPLGLQPVSLILSHVIDDVLHAVLPQRFRGLQSTIIPFLKHHEIN